MSIQTISLCMIVKNEEKELAVCLDSVKNFVDEIILVDTGSTDHTLEIASRFQAQIHQIPWPGDFSTARNFSLQFAKKDWILVLDADEKLDGESASQLPTILSSTAAIGLRLIQRNIYPPGELVRYHDIPITRLFQNRLDIRYEGLLHESVVEPILRSGGSIENSPLIIWHSGYTRSSVQGGKQRGERNLELLEKMLLDNPQDAYVHYQLGITYKQLGDNARANHHLKRVLELNTDSLTADIMGEVYMKLAQIELVENHEGECIHYAEKSLRFTPENITSKYLAALGYMSLGKVDLAYPYFLSIREAPAELLNDTNELDAVIAYCQAKLGLHR